MSGLSNNNTRTPEDDNVLRSPEEGQMTRFLSSSPANSSNSDEDDSSVLKAETDTPEKEVLWAAENGRLDIVQKLISVNPALIAAVDSSNYTALHRAAHGGHLEMAKWLLNNGADMTARTQDGWTAFHSACYWNRTAIVELLLSCGMDVNSATYGGLTGLHLTAGNSRAVDTSIILLSHPNIDTTLLNGGGETAYEIDVRGQLRGELYEMAEDCFRYL